MTEDVMMSRVLDKLDKLSEDVAGIKAEVSGVNKRLDLVNGNIAKHAGSIAETETWKTAKDIKDAELQKKVDGIGVDSAAVVKIACIASATILTIAKVGGSVLDAVLGQIK